MRNDIRHFAHHLCRCQWQNKLGQIISYTIDLEQTLSTNNQSNNTRLFVKEPRVQAQLVEEIVRLGIHHIYTRPLTSTASHTHVAISTHRLRGICAVATWSSLRQSTASSLTVSQQTATQQQNVITLIIILCRCCCLQQCSLIADRLLASHPQAQPATWTHLHTRTILF